MLLGLPEAFNTGVFLEAAAVHLLSSAEDKSTDRVKEEKEEREDCREILVGVEAPDNEARRVCVSL
jgi:predicted amidohydrolase